MDTSLYSSVLYVDMNIFRENLDILARMHKKLIPVLKCNSYGLGLTAAARVVDAHPATEMIALAQVMEAAQLRRDGIRSKLLVLGGSLPCQWQTAADLGITLTVTRPGMVAQLGQVGRPVSVHLKIETGLNRLGVRPGEELAQVIEELKASPTVKLTGTYSHFADAESRNRQRCVIQTGLYRQALQQLTCAGINPGLRHMCNSAGAEWMKEAEFDAVRIGRGLFMDSQDYPSVGIREVASWRAYIVSLRQLEAGSRLGYGTGILLPKSTRVAIVSVGYGDGLNQQVARGGPVLISGRQATLLGTCMDQCFVDVGDIPCSIGSEVTLFGYDEAGNLLSSQQVAKLCSDEGCGLTAALSNRVARLYRDDSGGVTVTSGSWPE